MALPSVAAFSHSKDSSRNEGTAHVKQERADEAEIEALAAKMVEANKVKMAAAANARLQQQLIGTQAGTMPGSIQNFLLRGNPLATAATATTAVPASSPLPPEESEEKKAPDDASQRGRFGWHTISNVHIPYMLRDGEDKYCAVRVAESKILSKYLAYLKPDAYTCTCIKSYYMTEAEARLMNEINMKHCDGTYGVAPFTVQDLVVSLKDAEEFQAFLEVCINKLVYDFSGPKDRCGFIRINGESVVPFTLCGDKKFVPLFYFEGETDSLKLKAEKLEGWNLSYLKFCCKVQGIRSELFSSDTCSVISLNDIRSYFPPGTSFEDYWPSKGVEKSLLLDPNRGQLGVPGVAWTVQPSKPPPPLPKAVAPKPVITTVQPQVATTMATVLNGWAGLVNGQSAYTNAATASILQQVQQQQQQQQYAAAARAAQPNLFRPGSTTSMLYSGNSVLPLQTSANQYYSGVAQGLQQQQQQQVLQTGATPQPPPLIRVSSASTSNVRQSPGYTMPNSQQQQQRQPSVITSQQQTLSATSQMLLNLGTPTATAAHQLLLQQQQQQQQQRNQQLQQQQQQQQHQLRLQQLQQLRAQQLIQHQQQRAQQQQQQQQAQRSIAQQQQQQRALAQQQQASRQASANKYPPPLVSSNGTSQSSRSPQQSQQQQQLRTSSRNSQPEDDGTRKLIPIQDVPAITGHHMPYKVQKALIEGRMVPCINAKPYQNAELLMTMSDLVEQFFPSVQLHTCRKVLQEVLHIDLYRGNKLQMQVLHQAGKCSSPSEVLPLVQVRSIMQFMPQMSYMFNRMGSNASSDQPGAKRQRTS